MNTNCHELFMNLLAGKTILCVAVGVYYQELENGCLAHQVAGKEKKTMKNNSSYLLGENRCFAKHF